MKNVLIVLFLFVSNIAFSQTYVGVGFDVFDLDLTNHNVQKIDGKSKDRNYFKINQGFSVFVSTNIVKGLFVNIRPNYRDAILETKIFSTPETSRGQEYENISIPLSFSYKLGLIKKDKFKISIAPEIGGFYSFMLSEGYQIGKKNDFGYLAALSLGFEIKKLTLQLGVKYDKGLNEVIHQSDTSNKFLEHRTAFAAIAYRLFD